LTLSKTNIAPESILDHLFDRLETNGHILNQSVPFLLRQVQHDRNRFLVGSICLVTVDGMEVALRFM
jgi:hypothetical protein